MCSFVKDFVQYGTGEMIPELPFEAVITTFRLIIVVFPEVGKNVTLHVPRIFLFCVRREETLQPPVFITIDTGLYRFNLSND